MTELEKDLEIKKSEEALVVAQIKKAEEDGRAAKRKNEELEKKLSGYKDINSELTLASETGLQAVKAMVKDKEEKMLARDLLQMEVNRLQGILNIKTDAVFGMEDMRKRLKMNMEERKEEIEGRYKRQRKELKALQQEIHCLSLRKKRLYLHCEKLQAKYEALLNRTKFEPGDKRSPQLFIAKAAKERESMQKEGYYLEQQVQEVQQEIQALEAAIEDVKEANELLRHSHRSPKMKELAEEQLQLKVELEQALENLQEKRKLEQFLQDDVACLESSLQNLQSENSTVMDCLKLLEEQVDIAYKEAEEQNQKYKRAKAQLSRLAKEIKSSQGDEVERISKEMQLAEYGETANEALYKLKLLASEFPDYAKLIEDKILEAGVTVPFAASSVRSGRSSVSSISSRASSRNQVQRRALSSSGSARSSRSGSVLNLEFNSEDS